MLQRTHKAGNGQDSPTRRARDKTCSFAAPDNIGSDSPSPSNYVDRQTSALNRRILPRGVDGRSAPAKRLMGLVRDLAKTVKDPEDPITRSRLVAAALLIMQQEALAHDLAAGKTVSCEDVVRVANATERALSRLK